VVPHSGHRNQRERVENDPGPPGRRACARSSGARIIVDGFHWYLDENADDNGGRALAAEGGGVRPELMVNGVHALERLRHLQRADAVDLGSTSSRSNRRISLAMRLGKIVGAQIRRADRVGLVDERGPARVDARACKTEREGEHEGEESELEPTMVPMDSRFSLPHCGGALLPHTEAELDRRQHEQPGREEDGPQWKSRRVGRFGSMGRLEVCLSASAASIRPNAVIAVVLDGREPEIERAAAGAFTGLN